MITFIYTHKHLAFPKTGRLTQLKIYTVYKTMKGKNNTFNRLFPIPHIVYLYFRNYVLNFFFFFLFRNNLSDIT